MRFLIMGAPGSGKGTQAQAITQRYQIPQISTGAIFRAAAKDGSELGRKLGALLASGDLVPDEITDQVVQQRLEAPDAASGWLLDGYPRTIEQVNALDAYLDSKEQTLSAVILLDVPHDELLGRLLKRAELEGRSDDTEAAIRHRMEICDLETRPVIESYATRGLVVKVDGVASPSVVQTRIAAALEEFLNR